MFHWFFKKGTTKLFYNSDSSSTIIWSSDVDQIDPSIRNLIDHRTYGYYKELKKDHHLYDEHIKGHENGEKFWMYNRRCGNIARTIFRIKDGQKEVQKILLLDKDIIHNKYFDLTPTGEWRPYVFGENFETFLKGLKNDELFLSHLDKWINKMFDQYKVDGDDQKLSGTAWSIVPDNFVIVHKENGDDDYICIDEEYNYRPGMCKSEFLFYLAWYLQKPGYDKIKFYDMLCEKYQCKPELEKWNSIRITLLNSIYACFGTKDFEESNEYTQENLNTCIQLAKKYLDVEK